MGFRISRRVTKFSRKYFITIQIFQNWNHDCQQSFRYVKQNFLKNSVNSLNPLVMIPMMPTFSYIPFLTNFYFWTHAYFSLYHGLYLYSSFDSGNRVFTDFMLLGRITFRHIMNYICIRHSSRFIHFSSIFADLI